MVMCGTRNFSSKLADLVLNIITYMEKFSPSIYPVWFLIYTLRASNFSSVLFLIEGLGLYAIGGGRKWVLNY